METRKNMEPMGRVADVLASVREKGVALWLENGRLRYRAPKGALAPHDIDRLMLHKNQVISLLEASDVETTPLGFGSGSRPYRAPLTFSQLAHWRFSRLGERRAVRQIASATRLCGTLCVQSLQEGLDVLVERHGGLRTRIVVRDGVHVQEVRQTLNYEVKMDDLTAFPESVREVEVVRAIEQQILEPIDVAVDTLFGVRLLKLREREHVLIIAMEHIVSDMYSMNILLRDLQLAYTRAVYGHAPSASEVPVQFADYALWQANRWKSWKEKHGPYWEQFCMQFRRDRFPEDAGARANSGFGSGTVSVEIDKALRMELTEWSRLQRTTLVMAVFTAYAALVLRWCDKSPARSVIRYLSNGRFDHGTENAIGAFATELYIRVELLESDRFIDLVDRITNEYCRAHEHADFSYLASSVPPPGFIGNAGFNWIPKQFSADVCDSGAPEESLTWSPVHFVHPLTARLELDSEPVILLFDSEERVLADINFPLNRFTFETMERFGRNFLGFIRALLKRPEQRVSDVVIT